MRRALLGSFSVIFVGRVVVASVAIAPFFSFFFPCVHFFLKRGMKQRERNFRKRHSLLFIRTNYTFTLTKTRKGTISDSHSATRPSFDRDSNPFARFAVRVESFCYRAFQFFYREKKTKKRTNCVCIFIIERERLEQNHRGDGSKRELRARHFPLKMDA